MKGKFFSNHAKEKKVENNNIDYEIYSQQKPHKHSFGIIAPKINSERDGAPKSEIEIL